MNKISDAEYRLMEIIWKNEPVNSTKLVHLSHEMLGWKKATTYTVIRKLCEKNILKNENATVTALVKRETVMRHESEELLNKGFHNSILSFMTCFLDGKKISEQEAEELKKLIDNARGINNV